VTSTTNKRRSARAAALFIAPSFIPLLAFFVLPMIAAAALSFTSWDLLSPPRWIGFGNFKQLVHDKEFLHSLINTLVFIAGYLPIVYILGLSAALALNRKFKGSIALRAMYFLPVITSWVIVALLWKWILNTTGGLVTYNRHPGTWLVD
jgi:multiple sugar transport system permease protein